MGVVTVVPTNLRDKVSHSGGDIVLTGSPDTMWGDGSDGTSAYRATSDPLNVMLADVAPQSFPSGIAAVKATMRVLLDSGNVDQRVDFWTGPLGTEAPAFASGPYAAFSGADITGTDPTATPGTTTTLTNLLLMDNTSGDPMTPEQLTALFEAGFTVGVARRPVSGTAGLTVFELSFQVVSLSPCYETLTATSWDAWADGNDATSVALGVSGATYSELTTYGGPTVLDLTANFRASSTEATDSTIDSVELGDSWNGTSFRNLTTSDPVAIPNDGLVRDYAVTFTTYAEDLATIRTALAAAGNAVLMFNTASPRDISIHEASVRVGHKCYVLAPPLRRYPPVNNGGFGPTRVHPRSPGRRAGKSY